MPSRLIGMIIASIGFIGLMVGAAAAQSYPTKPIKVVVAFAPGGPADVVGRLIATSLSQILGQHVFVENRPGAGGTLGARDVAMANPDGYTLLLGNTATLIISPLLYKNVGYDPASAFAPVAILGTTSNIMIANPASGLNTVQDVIDDARKNPGKLNFASAGVGTPLHLIGEMFKQRLHLDIVHVPYKSGGLATQAVITGETQFCFDSPEAALPFIRGGSVRGLAVTSEKRNPQVPDLPTMIEAGVPDFVSVSFTGVVAPAGTPDAIINKLNAAINQALKTDEVATALEHLAVERQISAPAAAVSFLANERTKWDDVIKHANIQLNE